VASFVVVQVYHYRFRFVKIEHFKLQNKYTFFETFYETNFYLKVYYFENTPLNFCWIISKIKNFMNIFVKKVKFCSFSYLNFFIMLNSNLKKILDNEDLKVCPVKFLRRNIKKLANGDWFCAGGPVDPMWPLCYYLEVWPQRVNIHERFLRSRVFGILESSHSSLIIRYLRRRIRNRISCACWPRCFR